MEAFLVVDDALLPPAAVVAEVVSATPALGYSWASFRQGTQSRNSKNPGGAFMSDEAHKAALATACGGRAWQ